MLNPLNCLVKIFTFVISENYFEMLAAKKNYFSINFVLKKIDCFCLNVIDHVL